MGKKALILEVSWVWDHFNTEIATISYEDYEKLEDRFENGLPNEHLMNDLKKVFDVIDRSIQGKGKMVRLYRIISPDYGCIARLNPKDGIVDLNLKLQAICEFDSDNRPIPLKV